MSLPIDPILPDLIAALRTHGQAVLQAPPGAGKTTRVPLAMRDAGMCDAGRIMMLEPRRLAARAAAERMADTLGEPVGQTIGYRMRGDSKISPVTQIEVVTEGILTRQLQRDPELRGIAAIIFDEFHERSLNADLGLALALEVRAALRPDLILLPMSATLDAGPVADLMGGAPVITAEGRSYPVTTHWLPKPLHRDARLPEATADLVETACEQTTGGVLVFLPGAYEIGRVQSLLAKRLPTTCDIRPLYGALPFAEQRAAIAPLPDPSRRKIVLATSIAETSLTIQDIRVVIDAGRARRARFDPGSGMSRLVTDRVSRAEATQRAGRAGRVAEGSCYKLWARAEDGALAAFPPAEIELADLTGLALELAAWGADEADLAFLTAPPAGALASARALLADLDILHDGRLTPHGTAVSALPLHPRLGHMLARAGRNAAPIAALLDARDPLVLRDIDLTLRLAALKQGGGQARGMADIRAQSKRLAKLAPTTDDIYSIGEMAALTYPDRIGKRRKGSEPRYVMTGGKGAVMDATDPLANAPFLVVADIDDRGREGRIRLGAALTEAEVRGLYGDRITLERTCQWSKRDGKVIAEQRERLGAVTLSATRWSDAPADEIAHAMCDGIRQLGLNLTGKAALFRARVELLRAAGRDMPPQNDSALLDTLNDWLLPHLDGVQTASDWKSFDPIPALRAMLSWEQTKCLDSETPAHFETPLGRKIAVDYAGDAPSITLRLQEMFGVTRHPLIGGVPLRVTLLSPGQKPLQTTTDIPGFWASSYADVRKDMRGRYPRHPWPEDPTEADPTLRVKRRVIKP